MPYHIDGTADHYNSEVQRASNLRSRQAPYNYLDDEESGLFDRMLKIDG